MQTPKAISEIAGLASPRPWTYCVGSSYHVPGMFRDWIEDATGKVILEHVGRLDGPLICAAVNAFKPNN